MEIRDRQTFLSYLDTTHGRTRRVIERYMYAETVQGKPSLYAGQGRDLADGLDHVLAFCDQRHAKSRGIFASLTPEQLEGKCLTPAGTPITTWKWLRAMFLS